MKSLKNISGFAMYRRSGFAIIACLVIFSSVVRAQNANRKPTPPSSTPLPSRSHVVNLSTTSSSGGSRVSLTSDQSLNNYEAYRSGDRFYVKIPPTDVRSPAARGPGFEDLKVQRSADSTVLSFRLQPGATARVEQQANQLSVVFRTAGARASSSALTQQPAPGNRQARSSGNQRGVAAPNPAGNTSATRNARSLLPAAGSAPSPSGSPYPNTTPASTSETNSQTSSSIATASPVAQATPVASGISNENGSLKERLQYLLLVAKLNPIPLAIGLAVIVLLIMLFLFQRRRAKERPTETPQQNNAPMEGAAKPQESNSSGPIATALPVATIRSNDQPIATALPLATIRSNDQPIATALPMASIPSNDQPIATALPVAPVRSNDQPIRHNKHETRIARVAEQIRRVLSGKDYDRTVVGSDDRATRQLVAAELVSALAGRGGSRHEYAREAFITNGYFEDATRDLHVGESPAERAAAALHLSFVHDPAATPHLIAALEDPAVEVRRAAVEALQDQCDPDAIAPLNKLLKTEADARLPKALIKKALEAGATAGTEEQSPAGVAQSHLPIAPKEFQRQSEREVIEI